MNKIIDFLKTESYEVTNIPSKNQTIEFRKNDRALCLGPTFVESISFSDSDGFVLHLEGESDDFEFPFESEDIVIDHLRIMIEHFEKTQTIFKNLGEANS